MRDSKLRVLEIVVLAQTPVLAVVVYLNLKADLWALAVLAGVALTLSVVGCGMILSGWFQAKPR